ncbi:tetratricopeptide repeat protein [Pseudodesulfovibrio senegalensis]|nr:tetratricopeptide repeat protein [Pseudodesulfovibrio senegalensis]
MKGKSTQYRLRAALPCLALIVLMGLGGCAMPKITLHDDALSPEEHLQLGVSYEQKGELQLAQEQYEQAKDLPEAWLYLGNVAFAMEKWLRAEKRYEKAIKHMPDDPRPRNNLAWLYYTRKRRLDRAEQLAQEAVGLAPKGKDAPYRDTLTSIRNARKIQAMK